MRVVLDTNVLVAALLFRKRLGSLGIAIDRGICVPCFCVTTFQELLRVLQYPKFAKAFAVAGLTADQITKAVSVKSIIVADPITIPDIAPDVPDNYILATGALANAECIVSGDRALLNLKAFHGIPIVSPQQFATTLRLTASH